MRHFLILAIALSSTHIALANDSELGFTKKKFAAMKKKFNEIQAQSFKDNREYCGYMGVNSKGKIVFTKAHKGRQDSCSVEDVPDDFNMIASYHTHGAFSPDADSEIPSDEDLIADIAEGVDGFIATPGGKVWFSDAQKEEVRLICGRNCVKSDPKFDQSQLTPVGDYYTLRDLKDFFSDD